MGKSRANAEISEISMMSHANSNATFELSGYGIRPATPVFSLREFRHVYSRGAQQIASVYILDRVCRTVVPR